VAAVRGPQPTRRARESVRPWHSIFKSRFYENFLFWCIFAIFIV